MAIERYRDVAELPAPPRPAAARLLRAMAAVWERAHLRVSPDVPRGVARFRTLEEAQADRLTRVRARARSLRDGTRTGNAT